MYQESQEHLAGSGFASEGAESEVFPANMIPPGPVVQERMVVILPSQRAEFDKEVARLNKKAVAYGLSPIEMLKVSNVTYVRSWETTRKGDLAMTMGRSEAAMPPGRGANLCERAPELVEVLEIHIRFPIIRMGTWEVIASIETLPPAGRLAYVLTDDPQSLAAVGHYRDGPSMCEHCNKKRARNDTYVLRSPGGAFKQVGRSCLKDFTGIDPAAALFLAKMYEFLNFNDDRPMADWDVSLVGTTEYLAQVLFLIEKLGFHSKSKVADEGGVATVEMSLKFDKLIEEAPEWVPQFADAFERLSAQAKAVQAWFAAKTETGTNFFDSNVKSLLANSVLPLDARALGFVCAGVNAYLKSQQEAKESLELPSKHVGKPGDKLKAEVRLIRRAAFPGFRGLIWLLVMRDDEGNLFVWRTGSPPDCLIYCDPDLFSFQISFTVKEHSEYRGKLQTDILRVKVLTWPEDPLDTDQT
mgnify:CR=1 FL=1